MDADGTVLYDSAADASAMENHLSREEIKEALETGSGKSAHFSDTLLEKTLYYAVRLSNGKVIRVSCIQSTAGAMLLNTLAPIAYLILALLLLTGLLSYRLAKRITKPLNELDLDAPREEQLYSELSPLIHRLQEQNATIRRQMEELSRKQQAFLAVTENMQEGFLLTDSKGSLLSGNRQARLLTDSAEGSAYKSEVRQCIDNALIGEHGDALLRFNDSVWQIFANPVTANGQITGAALIMTNVTERERRESLRREFSANVSHELKTPLTSISGFAELMKDGLVSREKMQEFSGDIYRESKRLIDLVEDIIDLSKLDENPDNLIWEDVDLYELCSETLNKIKPFAEKQNVTVEISGPHCTVKGVTSLLQELFYNLCDNGIKYNVNGGALTVLLGYRQERPFVTVEDTGVGIPAACQSRVFERFYRVDKSHSKSIGGTGLGLSIVKHAAQFHNAKIEMESTVGEGTAITVVFPERNE